MTTPTFELTPSFRLIHIGTQYRPTWKPADLRGDFRGGRVQVFETVLPGPCVAEGLAPDIAPVAPPNETLHVTAAQLGQRVKQRPGEAFIWSSKATDDAFTKTAVKIRCRPRVTHHGGATKTAVGG